MEDDISSALEESDTAEEEHSSSSEGKHQKYDSHLSLSSKEEESPTSSDESSSEKVESSSSSSSETLPSVDEIPQPSAVRLWKSEIKNTEATQDLSLGEADKGGISVLRKRSRTGLQGTSQIQDSERDVQTGKQAQGEGGNKAHCVPKEQETEEKSAGANQEAKEELEFKIGARHVIKLFIPVSLCMIFVVICINTIYANQPFEKPEEDKPRSLITPFYKDSSVDTKSTLLNSLLNAFVILGLVIFMTVVLVILFLFRCYKVLKIWFFFATTLMYIVFFVLLLQDVFRALNVPVDWVTVAVIEWNWCVLAAICTFWKGPLIFQQISLVMNCSVMAMFFIRNLPEWTSWFLLGIIAAWDLFAVLAPCGPLRILIEKAQERNEKLGPGLVYSSGMIFGMWNIGQRPNHYTGRLRGGGEKKEKESDPEKSADEHSDVSEASNDSEGDEEIDNVKLGLGDFIFFSLLVGKASVAGDWNTTIACFVAILVGLALTLLLLSLFQKALPALPISVATGLIFYFGSSEVISPFCSRLAYRRIFL